jgi:3-mercaptopyruvate sulfurtransferase SseA
MKRRKMLKTAFQYLFIALFVFAGAVACDSYDDTKAAEEYKNYYQSDNMLIEADTLKAWIDNGYKTEKGEPVVVVINAANAGSELDTEPGTGRWYIPGTIVFPDGLGGGNNAIGHRSDGPGGAASPNQVYDGPTMDRNLRYAGITKDTVIVITGNWTGAVPNTVTRMWWVLYYWGFAETKLKVLNGGNLAYADKAGGLSAMSSSPATGVAPSMFSVKDLPGNRIDLVRAPFGDVLRDARNGAYERKEQLMVSTLGTSICFGPGDTAPCTPNSGSVVRGRIHGGIQITPHSGTNVLTNPVTAATGNYVVYKTAVEMAGNFLDDDTGVSFLPADKNFRIITHCGSGQSTTVANFALVGVLGYKNVAIYDGSLTEWGSFSAYRYNPAFAGPTPTYVTGASNKDYVYWSNEVGFFVDRDGNKITDNSIILHTASHLLGYSRWDTSTASDYVQFFSGSITSVDLNPLYEGAGREVNEEDKIYQQGGDTGGGFDDGGGGIAAPGC